MSEPFYQYDSMNEKWIKTVAHMNEHSKLFDRDRINYNEVKIHFPLAVYNEVLQGVDPFDDNLSDLMKDAIIKECLMNPVYFMRECVKNDRGEYLRLNMAVIAVLKCIQNHSNIYLNIPYYDQYDFLVQTILIIISVMYNSSNNIAIDNFNWNNDLVVMPDYLKEKLQYSISKYDPTDVGNDAVYFLNEFDTDSVEYKYIDQLVAKQAAYTGMFKFPTVVVTNFQPNYIPKSRCVYYYNFYSFDNCEFRMPESHVMLRINYDIIEMEVNIRDSYKLINEKVDRESKNRLTTLDYIKLFAKYVLIKNYDELDVLEKLYINRIYADLSNGF